MVQKTFSVEVTKAQPGEGPTRRSILSPNQLMITPAKGVETLYDILQYASNTFKTRKGFGYRKLEDTISTTKKVKKVVNGVETTQDKTWTYFQLSGYHHYSYEEASTLTKTIGAGLIKLGLKKGDKVQISASTSVEWMFMAHGAFTQSLTIVTAYDTLGPDGLQHAINESEASLCFMNDDQLPILHKILAQCPTIDSVIYRGQAKPEHVDLLKSNAQIKHILSYEELEKLGQDNPVEVVEPSASDLCCIMYTSGSTGNPKGVMLTHGNVVAAIAGVCRMLQHLLEPNDTMMAYLPLAHVLEFLVENLCIFLGVTLGYGSIRTLTDVSVKNCSGDLQEFGPTIMTGVPQVWETIKKTVLTKVAERGSRVESIFGGAIKMKKFLGDYGLPTGLLDKVVFNNVKKQLGGRLRYCLSGGAPVSAETQEFLSLAVCPILQGYGMTESCGMCAIMAPEQWALCEVGSPVPCVEVKLVDQPELGYTSANKPRPQGEIWIRGPSITAGYYKQDDTTKETLTADGWLKTGDVGEWTERGTLSIIDRVKNLVKLSNGEYIALEKLESIYKSSTLVENMCVCAESLYPKPVGLLVPVEGPLRKFLTEHGVENDDYAALCASKEARKVVLQAMQEQAKKSGLRGAEIIADVWICKDLWTPEMGLLTAAQKLKRKDVNNAYEQELKDMFSALK
ncbi:long-chain-fatty-acid- ligase 1 protein [Mucor ambiguus]|uniref:Long-chain-fatty-acid-ligase 1 protein n=1 Tax=Mucor ambiguus TaxID=91626 RepID=A0A0C9MXX5_9FUNG|nr:long-chain-fatty-acid- ligase 1 protein [Mucor ambiguus]